MRNEEMSSNDFRALVPSNLSVSEYVEDEQPETEDFKPITSQEELDEIVGEEVKKIFEERRRKYREKKREKEEKTKKRFIKILIAIVVILLIVISVKIFAGVYPVAIYNFSDKQIYRNLSVIGSGIEDVPEPLPEMAWESNLPKFMRSDMENALEWGWTIKYKFHSHTIIIQREDSYYENGKAVWTLRVDEEDSYYSDLEFNDINQFSVFQDADGIYFYAFCKYGFFKVSIIGEEMHLECVSSYPKNVPLSVDYESAWDFCDTTLVRNGQKFTLWSGGIEKNSVVFEDGTIYEIPRGYNLIETTDNKLYSIFVYKLWDDYSTNVDIRYVGQIDNVTEILSHWYYDECLTFEFPRGEEYHFPIFKKNGEYYTCLPEDIKDYCSYSLHNRGKLNYLNEKSNLNMNLVKLDETNFVSANIYYTYIVNDDIEGYSWVADIVFEYEGTEYTCEECPIYGYDRVIDLPNLVEKALEREVYSVDEYWSAIESIRAEYEKFYDKRATDR